MSKKKKLLIVVDWFTPGYKAGGPIQSCVNLCRVLSNDFEIFVLTTDTDHGEPLPYDSIEANKWLFNEELSVQVYYAKKATLTAKQLAAQIEWVDADTVYLNHLFSPMFVVYPLWLKFNRSIKGKVVVCPRGALYQSALSLKSYKKRPLLWLYKTAGISKMARFHATNIREKNAIEHYFPGAEILIADNLPNTLQAPFESITKVPGLLKCIFIARVVPIKNLLFLLNLLHTVKGSVQLTIIGPIENESYWSECEAAIKSLPGHITVDYIGPQKNDELPELIKAHHLFVLPTTGENFGHAIFESLLAGRPVLISNQTPWLNLEEQFTGWDILLDEPGKFTAALNTAINFNQQQFEAWANAAWNFANNYIATSASRQQYITLFS